MRGNTFTFADNHTVNKATDDRNPKTNGITKPTFDSSRDQCTNDDTGKTNHRTNRQINPTEMSKEPWP